MRSNTMYYLKCCVALPALVALEPALAQEAPTASAAGTATADQSEAGSRLEDIVVTATRRASNLQTTPVAVSAISSEFIAARAPSNLGSLSVFVPNFSAARITGFNAASFSMRGIGQNAIIVYFEPPVAMLVDDFVVSSVQTQLLDTFDIDQIEVLRGPQGTLFGKNTTGGAVSVRTKAPILGKFGADGEALIGSFGTREAKAAINVPLGDTLALRLVGAYAKSDGYMRNGAAYGPIVAFAPSKFAGLSGTGPGDRVGGQDVFNGRAKLLWEPSDNFSALLQYELLRDRSETPGTINVTPQGDNSYLFNVLGFTQGSGDPYQLAGLTNRKGLFIDQDKGQIIDVDGGYLNLKWNFARGTISSITGYRRQYSSLPTVLTGQPPVTAADGDAFSIFDIHRSDVRRTLQQEVRYASDFDGPFKIVAGGFFQRETIKFCVSQLVGFLDLSGATTPYGPYNTNPYFVCNGQRSRSVAGFGEVNYDVTDKLTLTGGFRYTWEHKRWQGRQQVFAQDLLGPSATYLDLGSLLNAADFKRFPQGVITDSHSWAEPTYRLSASYKFTDRVFGYATFSHGFKSGGYNDQIGSFGAFGSDLAAFRAAAQPTDVEKATSYEAGIKSELFDRRLRANVTGFYVEYKDLQRQIVIPLTVNGQPGQVTTYFNAAGARVKGIEAEFTAVPFEALQLRAIVGYQDGRYDSYLTPVPSGYDLSTSPLDRTPKWQWTLDATYRLPIGSVGTLVANATVNHASRNLYAQSITSPDQNTFLVARTLLDASLTYNDKDNRYFVRLIGRNLTNKTYNDSGLNVGSLFAFGTIAPPRFYGVQVGLSLK